MKLWMTLAREPAMVSGWRGRHQSSCVQGLAVLPLTGVTERTVESTCSVKPPANPAVCPLSRVASGSLVRIKELQATPELCRRLREMGLREEQQIGIVLQDSNVVCRVCNVRLGLSAKLADKIMVEPVQPRKTAEN